MVRWQGVKFERDAAADASKVKQPGKPTKDAPTKATYKAGSVAKLYGDELETMPPLKHDRDPSQSEVVAHICEKVAGIEGECSLVEGQRIYHALACMKHNCPIIFDRSTCLWRGRKYVR